MSTDPPGVEPPDDSTDLPTIDPIEEMVADYIGLRLEQVEITPTEFAERVPEGMRTELIDRLERYESVREALPQAVTALKNTPEQLGDFRVVGELGRGGAGIVFRAEQLSLRRTVALKILPPAAGLSANSIERFLDGAVAAARLRHPNIVPVYTAGEQDGLLYLSMEYVPGPSLSYVLRQMRSIPVAERTGDQLVRFLDQTEAPLRGRAPIGRHDPRGRSWEEVVVRMGEGLAEALAYCLRCGVLHRDVKPGNIILAPDGTPKLVDFGLARVEDLQDRVTITGEVWGTPQYLAPERIQVGLKAANQVSEVYALAATLYECLANHPPHSGEDGALGPLLLKIANEDPESLKGHDVSPDLAHVIMTALARNPDHRHPSPIALAEDLRAVRKGRRPPHAYRLKRSTWHVRRRRRVVLGGLFLVLLLFLLAQLLRQQGGASHGREEVFLEAGQHELAGLGRQARELLTQAARTRPADAWIRFELWALRGRLAVARTTDRAQHERAAEEDERLALHVAAQECRRVEDWQGAFEYYNRALDLDPGSRWSKFERGLMALRLGHREAGLRDLFEAVRHE